ncbi:antitoxin of toxin-antitoxin stability system [Escherichia coli]|uniref:antitoxin of toxin-antitoxin stability system n=1 Tax=Escherichia coli TaxID=562 RepID=UPI000DDBF018|nr:antitoxin of toxin-antitoxin stability system [Escherichia coli]EIT4643231.1 antitoxin of toxin-antitoxin stability system [Escherichia coli]MDI4461509.1 antitoxin of toxin-antitoxin stability system [Escherichia coli]
MSKIISTTVYTLDELSATAREHARAWYREGGLDYDWYSDVYDDFGDICRIFGVSLRTRTVRTTGDRYREETCIWFSGFSHQGDGACFEGHYRYQPQAAREIRVHAPQDSELHRIADALQAIQQRNFWQLQADIHHRGRYYHEYSMVMTVGRNSPTGQEMTDDSEDTVTDALRDLARWLYRQLDAEYDGLSSSASVDEAIRANEYTFNGSGQRFG